MVSHGRNIDADEVQRPKELITMGRDTRKAQCTMLYVHDSNKEKRSKTLRSILGVLPCLILKIWRLWARTKNGYTVDDFFIFTIREPCLLKIISTSNASTWLARRESMLQGHRDSRQGTKSTEISKDYYKERKTTKGVPKFSCAKDDFMRKLQNNLAHTFTYFVNLRFWQLIIFKVWKFSKLMRWTSLRRHYAHARAVWCSWCTLEWLGYPYDELVIARSITGREGSEWRVAFSQPRYLERS
jgi:hypothetical protein